MRPRFLLPIAVLVLVAIGTLSYQYFSRDSDESSRPLVQPKKIHRVRPMQANGFRDEAHWLVSTVVCEMSAWSSASLARVLPANDDWTDYRVELANASIPLQLKHHVWSAEDYLSVAQKMVPEPAVGHNWNKSEELANALLTPSLVVMLEQNRNVSLALIASPGDPELHEAAALLFATMAFREAAGRFCDSRRELCAVTAHLALAKARKPAPGICAKIATGIVETLAGRESAALECVASLPVSGPLSGWGRALRLRITGDWRVTPITATGSMVEKLAYLRTTLARRNPEAAGHWFQECDAESAPDWGRIMCESWLSVQLGHAFAGNGIAEELTERNLLWQSITGEKLQKDSFSKALALKDKPDAPRRVISAGRWTAFLNRHLAHRVVAAYIFVNEMWGVPEEAEKILSLCSGPLKDLPLMPLIRIQIGNERYRTEFASSAGDFVRKNPEILTAWLWNHVVNAGELGEMKRQLPKARDWWTLAPPGTTYHASVRLPFFESLATQEPAILAAIQTLAPHNSEILQAQARLQGINDAVGRTKFYAPLLPYDEDLSWDIAKHAATLPERIETYRRLASFNAKACFRLGNLLVEAKQDQEAVAAFERGFQESTDRVSVSNSIQWLVEWYAKHDNLKRAQEIADDAYEVFSKCGIETKAWLEEYKGNYKVAEKALRDLQERYGHTDPLYDFWARTAAKVPESKKRVDEYLAVSFLKGQQKIEEKDLVGAPSKGLIVSEDSEMSRKLKVFKGNIIIGVDGIRCENDDQYQAVRYANWGKPMELTIWNGKTYQRISTDNPNRRFGIFTKSWP